MEEKLFDEGYFKGEEGENLYYQAWWPRSGEHAGDIIILHGLGEYSGRYKEFCTSLSEAGFNLFLYDLRGHGRSAGRRGDIPSFDTYIRDSEGFLDFLKGKYGIKRETSCILGHSMGGLIALHLCASDPLFKGLILSSPFFGIHKKIPSLKYHSARLMSRIFPYLSIPNEIDPSLLSHDREVVSLYETDPLVFRKITLRWFFETIKAIEGAPQAARRIELPLLMILAGDDRIVDTEKSKEMFYLIPSKEKSLKVYDGYYHEVFNEERRAVVREDLLNWLESRG